MQHFVLFCSHLISAKALVRRFFLGLFFTFTCFRSESMSSTALRILEQLGISAVRNRERLEKLGIVSISQLLHNYVILLKTGNH